MTSEGNWSELPTDLLQIICEKLITAKDYARFGAVCTSWGSVVWQSRYQVPVLMFPNSSKEHTFNPYKTKYTHNYFSIREDLHVPILPVTSDKYIRVCLGSCHGWLLINESSCLDMLQLHLWNPFLSVDIKLPSLYGEYIVKATLSSNPTWTSDYAVMVIIIFGWQSRLAFFKTGDKSWTCINNNLEPGSSFDFQDVIFYKDQSYILCPSELVSCDITRTKPKLTRVASLPLRKYSYRWCLVESSGDLLCVAREVDPVENCFLHSTVGFRIFKFLTNKELHWIELKTLRGHTLFLGDCTSLSLLSSDFHQCKSNHIYFAYSCLGVIDKGMFNLEDSSLKPLFSETNIYEMLYHPVWVQPTLNITNDPEDWVQPSLNITNDPDWVQPSLNLSRTISIKNHVFHYISKLFWMIICMKDD